MQSDSDLALAEVTLTRADALLRAELAAADTTDLKAVGLATADVAALTVLITFHRSVWGWWASALLLIASAICFFVVLRQRYWQLGTEPRDFWAENTGSPRVAILESALASTEENREHNEPFLVSKGIWFLWGYRTLAAGLIVLSRDCRLACPVR